MPQYALLILPSANRVYATASVALTEAELGVFNEEVLGGRLTDVGTREIAGVPYVTFTADALSDRDVAYLANLSSVYALFEQVGDLLRPVPLRRLDRYDDDLITIPKYAGKTNEQFTKLLLNVTVLASASGTAMLDRRLRILDPLCGRGTTLNQAVMYGYDAAGIDIDGKDFDAYRAFLTTWLTRKRLKHHIDVAPVRRERKQIGRRMHVTLAASKERHKAGDIQELTVICADTTRALDFFRPRTFDALVTDAPYGVHHGSRATNRQGTPALSRKPLDLLAAAVPVWTELLRPGGALGISWNTHVASRDAAAEILAASGLHVVDSGPYRGFRHRVDQSITRDILVARKPS